MIIILYLNNIVKLNIIIIYYCDIFETLVYNFKYTNLIIIAVNNNNNTVINYYYNCQYNYTTA